MYLGGVNRGISFTKAGAYTTGLVLLLGFFATGSGYNGLFLSLGFGLSFLIISGMLSEKTIQAAELKSLADTTAEAHVPFSVDFRLHNRSRSWFIFSLESLVTTELPKFKILQPHVTSLMEARLLILPPAQTLTVSGRSKGMPRGWYHNFYIIQRTLFPFGLISKFKVGKMTANISVLPALDNEFDAQFSQELHARLVNQPEDPQFHSHRPMAPHTPVHSLDLKKNAGRPEDQWVMKLFESPASDFGFLIEANWADLQSMTDEGQFERYLSRLRTAGEALRRTQRPLMLRTPDGRFAVGYDLITACLTRVPRHSDRQMILNTVVGQPAKSGFFSKSTNWSAID